MSSCKKDIPTFSDEIILKIDESATFDVTTKTTATTSVPSSLYWCATTGTSGSSDSQKYASTSSSVSSGKISTGKYQTATATTYNWYVADASISIASSGPTISVNNSVDHIAGSAKATTSTTPSVSLKHIFARTGSITSSPSISGFTITSASYSIVGTSNINGTAGVYNIATEAWTSATSKLSSATTLTSSSSASDANGLYLLPGTYTIKVTYDYKDASGSTKTGATASAENVTIVGGKVNNLSCTLPVSSLDVELLVTVSLSDWTNSSVSPKFKSGNE